jgi:UDP-N-acetylglucosamine 2-epimerase (non-hydrolysing)
MVRQIFGNFGISVDHELRVMRPGQSLSRLSARLVENLGKFVGEQKAAAVLVQGDTSSAFFGALCGFYHHLPIGHVEAGLRTGNRYAPFPEEMNRTLLSALATWHFAPTKQAVAHLRSEGVPASSIYLTGNTVVDALRAMASQIGIGAVERIVGVNRIGDPLILVTCHRRESLGPQMKEVAAGLAELARRHPETVMLFPLHPNPAVRRAVVPKLKRLRNVVLTEPLGYQEFLSSLKHAFLVISDSGGVQEEATSLGKPVLVLRSETERPEGVRAGALKLVGTDPAEILFEAERLLKDRAAYRRMSRASNVFGDGHAGARIVKILERSLVGKGGHPTAFDRKSSRRATL